MSKEYAGCAVELVDNAGDRGFWLFFKDKETAKQIVCTQSFYENYEYPIKATFCNICMNDDNIPIACSDFHSSEVYYFLE